MIQFPLSKALPSKMRLVKQTEFYLNKPQGFLVNLLQIEEFQGCLIPSLVFINAASTKKRPQKDAQLPTPMLLRSAPLSQFLRPSYFLLW